MANFVGSLVPAVVWGVAFTDLVHGVPLAPDGRYFGGLPGLLHPIALVGGLASLAVFVQHGSLFLSLKTSGDVAVRARRAAGYAGVVAVAALGGTVAWVAADSRPAVGGSVTAVVPLVLGIGAVAAVAAATALALAHHDGWAFAATGAAILRRWEPCSAGCSPSSCRQATGRPTPSRSPRRRRSTTRSS